MEDPSFATTVSMPTPQMSPTSHCSSQLLGLPEKKSELGTVQEEAKSCSSTAQATPRETASPDTGP